MIFCNRSLLADVAQWEPDGTIPFFLTPQQQTLTADDFQCVKKPFSFPNVIIKEGKIDFNELQKFGKDNAWLQNKLSIYNVDVHDILLATLDQFDEMIDLYDKPTRVPN